MSKELFSTVDRQVDTADLAGTAYLPGTGSRLVVGRVYQLPTLASARAGRAFVKSKPDGFTDEFYQLVLDDTLKVPFGTFFRERTSAEGRITDWTGNAVLRIAPIGAPVDVFTRCIGEGAPLCRLLARLLAGGSAIRVVRAIDVLTKFNGELKPRQVYEFSFEGTPTPEADLRAWLGEVLNAPAATRPVDTNAPAL